ncbi:MAG: helix-turn-helix domain-containing protein [Bacteroidales bacterium]
MNRFTDYERDAKFEIFPELLDIIKQDDHYQVFQGKDPLLTPGGIPVRHESERLIQLIITDLLFRGIDKKTGISASMLFAYQKDTVEKGDGPFESGWDDLLKTDPFVIIKTTNKNTFQPFRADDRLFSFAFITLSALINSINDFVNETMGEVDLQDTEAHPFPELLKLSYSQLPPAQKVVIQALGGLHQAGLVLPLVLVSGIISPLEYSKGLVAMKIQPESYYDSIVRDVTCAMDFLQCSRLKSEVGQQLNLMIHQGETDAIEFKSTLRWDIRAGKTNQAVERACLKTISAFLNSKGGTLLIGVRDDGSIEGIESDKFVNEDKFLLHLWTLIRTCLGREVSRYLRTHLEKMEEKMVCVVQCLQSSRPVFLRQPGFNEEFFIRVGPSSNAMDISEALKYIADHFPGR